jgi:hypothetical protein
MKIRSIITCVASVLVVVGVAQNEAAASLTPVGASTAAPIAYTSDGSSVTNVYDGVLNYDQYLALGQDGHGSFGGPYTVQFDLGAAYDLTGFNLWNNGGYLETDGEGVNSFTLSFFDPSSASVGSWSGNATDTLAMQSFNFAASNVQTVDFTINSNWAPDGPDGRQYVIFYEANFEGSPIRAPVPAGVLLGIIGLGTAGLRLRRRMDRTGENQ